MVDFSFSQPTDTHLEELLAGYALNALSPEETAELEHYLRQHPELEQQLSELQAVMGYLGQAFQESAPASLRTRILSIPHLSPAPTSAPATPQHRWSWRSPCGAIAALLIVGLSIDNVLLRQRLTALQVEFTPASTEENYVFHLAGTAEATPASAKVIVDIHAGEVLMGVQNLPPLPPQETYQLWAFTADQTGILCGRFNTDETGQAIAHFSVSPDLYTSPIAVMRIAKSSIDSALDASSLQEDWLLTSQS